VKPTIVLTAALLCALSPLSFAKPLKVFILAGQSNMEGQGSVDHDDERDSNGGKGNLVWSMANSKSAEKMKKLKNEKGEWVVRDDVRISFKVGDKVLKGGLTVGTPVKLPMLAHVWRYSVSRLAANSSIVFPFPGSPRGFERWRHGSFS
jgi:hypothetical protein